MIKTDIKSLLEIKDNDIILVRRFKNLAVVLAKHNDMYEIQLMPTHKSSTGVLNIVHYPLYRFDEPLVNSILDGFRVVAEIIPDGCDDDSISFISITYSIIFKITEYDGTITYTIEKVAKDASITRTNYILTSKSGFPVLSLLEDDIITVVYDSAYSAYMNDTLPKISLVNSFIKINKNMVMHIFYEPEVPFVNEMRYTVSFYPRYNKVIFDYILLKIEHLTIDEVINISNQLTYSKKFVGNVFKVNNKIEYDISMNIFNDKAFVYRVTICNLFSNGKIDYNDSKYDEILMFVDKGKSIRLSNNGDTYYPLSVTHITRERKMANDDLFDYSNTCAYEVKSIKIK